MYCTIIASLSQSLLDDMLVETVRGIWLHAGKKNSKEISSALREAFNTHPSVTKLVLHFLESSGSRQSPRRSIAWIVTDEFLKWTKEEGRKHVTYTCSSEEQTQVLVVLERCHVALFDNICEIFDLKHSDRGQLVKLIRTLLDNYQHNEVT